MAIQKTYNIMNSKSGLMVQQLPHHLQQQHNQLTHSFEDRLQSNLNRNSNETTNQLLNPSETTDGSQLYGQPFPSVATDITSSTSSLSSSLSSHTNHTNNCEIKSLINITNNSLQSKSDDRDSAYGSIKANNKSTGSLANCSTINNNNNNLLNDWHKVKRRPVVASNEMEEELALQVSAQPEKSIELESIPQQPSQALPEEKSTQSQSSDCLKVDSNQLNANKNKMKTDLTLNKCSESVDKGSESDINLIKGETDCEGIDSNLMNENNNNKDKDCVINTDNPLNSLPNSTSNKGTAGVVGAKRMKGNLKCKQLNGNEDHNNCSNGSNGTHPLVVSRRVSFDPLALLLDAALEGELELVKKTAKEVPNPSAANDEGITALHNAICAGHFDIVKYLVENGCDVNAQDSDGWTPLHCAASCNNLSMVKFLVENGACIFATTLSDQETAAEKCEEDEEGFDGCSQYLYGVQEKLGILNGTQVFAVYDYDSQNADELSFKDGNVITVMRKGDEQEREWWWARINDREGYVPRNLLGLYPRVKHNKELQTIAEENNE